MRLTYATDFDITNLSNRSGLGYYYGIMLKNAGFDLEYLNNINTPYRPLHWIKQQFVKRVMGKTYSHNYNVNVSKIYAQILKKEIAPGIPIISPNTTVLAYANNQNKRILYTDATLERLENFYPQYLRLYPQCIIDGHEIEKQAIQNCDLLIYSSQWAADSAINFYHADPRKVFIVPFGANLKITPTTSDIKNIIRKKCSQKELHILFIGVDWKRKGGDKALEVIRGLRDKGLDVTLHIAGIKEKLSIDVDQNIINHGFIEKSTIGGQEKLAELFSMCHFLLLPTIADCTPVVFSEANAYGMPCITTNVGGNSGIILDDINGRVFNPYCFTEETVRYITEIWGDPQAYEQLCFSSYDRYNTELNWTTTGKKIFKLINEL